MSERKTLWPSLVYLAINAFFLTLPDRLNLNVLLWACFVVLALDLLWRIWHNWRAGRRGCSDGK